MLYIDNVEKLDYFKFAEIDGGTKSYWICTICTYGDYILRLLEPRRAAATDI